MGKSANGKTDRRTRLREATISEIRASARRLLVAGGKPAVTINAIAREMGMSGPALYRYYSNLAELMEALRGEIFAELIETLTTARNGSGADTPGQRLLTMCRALRGWAVSHPAEFECLFASPVPRGERQYSPGDTHSGQAFGRVFLEQIVEIWETRRFPLPSLEDMAPSLADQLSAYSQRIGGRLPPEAAYIFLTCWMRLYGLLCMEVLNQISFAFSDAEPVYEECLQDLCRLLDIAYDPPAD